MPTSNPAIVACQLALGVFQREHAQMCLTAVCDPHRTASRQDQGAECCAVQCETHATVGTARFHRGDEQAIG